MRQIQLETSRCRSGQFRKEPLRFATKVYTLSRRSPLSSLYLPGSNVKCESQCDVSPLVRSRPFDKYLHRSFWPNTDVGVHVARVKGLNRTDHDT